MGKERGLVSLDLEFRAVTVERICASTELLFVTAVTDDRARPWHVPLGLTLRPSLATVQPVESAENRRVWRSDDRPFDDPN